MEIKTYNRNKQDIERRKTHRPRNVEMHAETSLCSEGLIRKLGGSS